EDPVVQRPGARECALDPPGRVLLHRDPGTADDRSDLPGLGDAMRLDVEISGEAEVALAPGGEANIAADPRDAERPDGLAIQVLTDDVPRSEEHTSELQSR